MIKNQLYPYIEKYINEYLFGFTKEQLNIGVMNGQIVLDNLIIRPDTTNEKLNENELPIWIKAGIIRKIFIGCSIMNFLGEKPLEIVIEDIDLIISPSFKWVNRNLNTFIVELENHMREIYDPVDNNSSDIFTRKINFVDSTLFSKLKKPLIKIFSDETFFSKMIANIYTKVVKFFYKKSYLIKLTVKNINLRFEDDTFNYYGHNVFGLKINLFEVNLSVDGVNKKDSFKIEGIDLIWEGKNPKILVPSKLLNDNLDVDNKIKDDKYFDMIRKLNLKFNNSQSVKLLDNFNFCGNFGISIVDSKNIDFFSKAQEKNYNFYLQVATSELKIAIYPELIQILENFINVAKSHFIIEQIQDFKPMRRPYEKSNQIVVKLKDLPKFQKKRKMVVRDWFYYMIWFTRVKKALYAKYFNNEIHEEFSKYFSFAYVNQMNQNPENPPDLKNEDLNPEKVNFNLSIEVLVKAINVMLMKPSIARESKGGEDNYLNLKIIGIENKLYLKNKTADYIFNFKNLSLSSEKQVFIDKSFDETLTKSLKTKQKLGMNECQILSTLQTERPLKTTNRKNNFGMVQDTISDEDSQELFSEDKHTEDKTVSSKLLLLNDILSNIDTKKNGSSNGPSAVNNRQFDNKSEISVVTNQTNTTHRSFLKVFLNQKDPLQEDKKAKKLKGLEISNKVLEYNKEMIRKNSAVRIDHKVEPKRAISINGVVNSSSQPNQKVKLNLFELSGTGNDHAMKLNIKKEIFQGKLSENLTLQFDSIRSNIIPLLANSVLSILLPYLQVLKRLFNIKKIAEKLDFSYKLEVNEMRKYAINKLRDNTSFESQQYIEFLTNACDSYKNISPKNFEVDFIFYYLLNNNFEVNINYNDFFILGIDYAPKQLSGNSANNKEILIDQSSNVDYCKIRLPDIDLSLKLTESSIFSKLFDSEFRYNNLDKWKTVCSNIFSVLKSQISPHTSMVFPLFKRILAESKFQFNEENEIKNIINSNLRSMKVDFNNGEYTDRTEDLKCLSEDD